MEPYLFVLFFTLSIAIIGGVGALLWQLLLSRDKQLNQKAHLRALEKEMQALAQLRHQQEGGRRFRAHYAVLGENRTAIEKIDEKITRLFEKKQKLIESYGKMIQNESNAMIKNFYPFSQRETPDRLSRDFYETFQAYDAELASLQAQRASLWTIRADFQKHLLDEEKVRNEKLDKLYHRHTALLEKIYLSQLKNTETIDKASIEAGQESFKYTLFYPFQFLASFFGGIKKEDALKKTAHEISRREAIRKIEDEINYNTPLNLPSYTHGSD